MKSQHYILALIIFLVEFSGTPSDANRSKLFELSPVTPNNKPINKPLETMSIDNEIIFIKEQQKIIEIQTKMYDNY